MRSSRQGQSWQLFDSNEEAARRFEILDSTPDVRGQREEALRQLSLEPGETVIDVGCGPGYGRYFFGTMRYFFLLENRSRGARGTGSMTAACLSSKHSNDCVPVYKGLLWSCLDHPGVMHVGTAEHQSRTNENAQDEFHMSPPLRSESRMYTRYSYMVRCNRRR